MNNSTLKVAAAILTAGCVVSAGSALADKDEAQAMSKAKISLVEAIQSAEQSQGGVALEAGIDDDSFKPEYEVTILREDRQYDVREDAVSGAIIDSLEDIDD
jgi:uncharacterized membrane protein YkoI